MNAISDPLLLDCEGAGQSPANKNSVKNIILIGNPNCGKTTLFNRLTGMRQRVGNFPGVTVEKKIGSISLHGTHAQIIDLPGCYNLSPHTEDEQVALDALFGHNNAQPPDLAVAVVDALNLSRHLLLVLQLFDLEIPVILAVNRWDLLAKSGKSIDLSLLSERLGIPVIPVSAVTGWGVHELKSQIFNSLSSPKAPHPILWPDFIKSISNELSERHRGTRLGFAIWRRLLFSRQYTRSLEKLITAENVQPTIQMGRQLIEQHGYHPMAAETLILRKLAFRILENVEVQCTDTKYDATHKLDRILTHRVYGVLIFALIMPIMFFMLFTLSAPVVELLEIATEHLSILSSTMEFLPPWTISLIADGIIGGVGGVLTFLPQIIILFFLIGLLEDSGYMARAACVMDRWMSRCGLNGKSMVPMLSSFACAIPGVMATRTIEQPKTRLTTMLVTPLISCSARLPVYTLLVGAIIVPRYGHAAGAITLFSLHLLGILLAFPAAWLLNRKLFKSGHTPLILEMPDYSWPRLRDLFQRVYNSALSFVRRAGTLIVLVSMVIWALAYFPVSENETELDKTTQMENSYLGRLGHLIQPVFAPAGFDWKISVGVLASFPAREVIVATMGVLYPAHEGDETISAALRNATWAGGAKAGQPVFTIPTAVALLVFIALCMQCAATLVTIARESAWRWALGVYTVYTAIAWLAAVITYQSLSAFGL